MGWFEIALSAATALIMFLLGAERIGMGKLSDKLDGIHDEIKGEIAELKLCMTANYALRSENTEAHKELWQEVNKSREALARVRGKLNGE